MFVWAAAAAESFDDTSSVFRPKEIRQWGEALGFKPAVLARLRLCMNDLTDHSAKSGENSFESRDVQWGFGDWGPGLMDSGGNTVR